MPFFSQKHQNDLWMGVVLRCSNNSYKRKDKLVVQGCWALFLLLAWHLQLILKTHFAEEVFNAFKPAS